MNSAARLRLAVLREEAEADLADAERRLEVDRRLGDHHLHAPAHLDAEVLSALGGLHRAGDLPAEKVERYLSVLDRIPLERHDLAPLLAGAWARRARVRLVDALYVELAARLDAPLVTTDLRLRNEPNVETIEI